MALSNPVREICDQCHISSLSTSWCSVCEETLCQNCKERHDLLEVTRCHDDKSRPDAHKQLKQGVSQMNPYCSDHDESFLMYCKSHHCPFCAKCIHPHSKCSDIISLLQRASDTKNSKEFKDTIRTLKDMNKNFQHIKIERENNLVIITEQRKRFEMEIENMRQNINTNLDKIQGQLISELSIMENGFREKNKRSIRKIENIHIEIQKYQHFMQNVMQCGTDIQAFAGMRDIQDKILKDEEHLQSLIDGNHLRNVSLCCTLDPKIKELTSLKQFGSVSLPTKPSNVQLIRRKERQMVPKSIPVSDFQMKLLQIYEEDVESGHIKGCAISPKEEILLTNYHESCLIYLSKDGTTEYKISIKPQDAFDIALINDTTAAVTSGSCEEQCVTLVDVVTRQMTKVINLTGHPFGINANDGFIFICIKDQGIQLLDRTTFLPSTTIEKNLPWGSYVAVHKDNVFYTDYYTHNVICLDLKGEERWTFNQVSILKEPTGIVVDNKGFVYVSGKKSVNVVVIAPDGKQCRQLLTKEDGLTAPTGIAFDKTKQKLLVANHTNTVCLYEFLEPQETSP